MNGVVTQQPRQIYIFTVFISIKYTISGSWSKCSSRSSFNISRWCFVVVLSCSFLIVVVSCSSYPNLCLWAGDFYYTLFPRTFSDCSNPSSGGLLECCRVEVPTQSEEISPLWAIYRGHRISHGATFSWCILGNLLILSGHVTVVLGCMDTIVGVMELTSVTWVMGHI